MRNFTLLIGGLLFSGLLFSQRIPVMPEATLKPQKLQIKETSCENAIKPNIASNSKEVIWSDDFSDTTKWTFSSGPSATGGSWEIGVNAGSLDQYSSYAGTNPFNPPTKANGGAFINGIQYVLSPPVPVIDAYITWNGGPINLSSSPNVSLTFYERYKAFNHDDVFAEISTDNINWQSIQLHSELAANSYYVGDYTELNISGYAGGSPTVWIRFHFQGLNNDQNYGSGYGWRIDDVALINTPQNDLILQNIFPEFVDTLGYINGYYSKIPYNQVMDVYFGAKVYNYGVIEQTNAALTIDVNDYNTSVFNTTGPALLTIVSDTTDSLGTDLPFTPPAIPKKYLTTLTVTQTELDENMVNNIDTVSFAVSDSVYAHDYKRTGYISPLMFSGSADGDFFGSRFYIRNSTEINSISTYIYSAASLLNSVGSALIGKVFKYDGTTWYEVASTMIYEIDSSDLNTWITIPIVKDGTSELLAGGDMYIVGFEFYWSTGGLYIGEDDTPIHTWETETALRIGTTWYYTSSGLGLVRLNVKIPPMIPGVFISSKTDVSCIGGNNGSATATAFGGTPPYTFVWSNGSTTSTATNLSEGIYFVTITDANSVTATDTVAINQPEVLTSVFVTTEPACFSENNGSINSIPAGGTPPFSYIWSSGDIVHDPSGLQSGTYYVTITDEKGCILLDTITLTEPAALVIAGVVTHSNGNDGAVDVTVTGGMQPIISYAWTGPNSYTASTPDIIDLAPGTYTVVVTDFNGCTVSATFYVNNLLLCNTFQTTFTYSDITCNGHNDGAIDATVVGGTAPYIFQWSTGAITEDISALSPGTYGSTITDANSCVIAGYFTITEPAALSVTYDAKNSCYGANNGSIDLTIIGGTLPYVFDWSNDSTTEDLSSLAPDTFYVIVTDTNGCQILDSVIITEPDTALSLTFATTIVTTIGGSNGAIDLSVSGGTPPYSFLWSNTETTEDIDSLTAGMYTVAIIDANLCSLVDSTEVIQLPCSLTVTATYFNVTGCYGDSSGTISLAIDSGATPYLINWLNGGTNDTIVNLAAGTYICVVTDSVGCLVSDTIILTQPPQITVTGLINHATGSVNITVSNGIPPFTYLWSNGTTAEDLSSVANGYYSVTVTDSFGCTGVSQNFGVSIAKITTDEPVTIYPNPTKGIVYLKNAKNSTVTIYNIIGKAVTSFSNSATLTSIDMSKYSEGTYLIKVVTDKSIYTQRIYLVK